MEEAGVDCVGFDTHADARESIRKTGAETAATLSELVKKLTPPRAVWMMVPSGVVDAVLDDLVPLLHAGDMIIDGGNSHYVEDIRRAKAVADKDIMYVDVGVSGGVWGRERGYCQMIGGPQSAYEHLKPAFVALAPGVETAERTPGRRGPPAPAEHGYLHCGDNGAGHFVKMVHNGIEYGLM